MFNIVFMFQGFGNELFFRRALQNIDAQFGVSAVFFDTMEIDNSPDEYAKCAEAVRAADFVYLSLHGGLPYFRTFQNLHKDGLSGKPAFLHSEIEDENPELKALGGLVPNVYDKLMKYFRAGGENNMESFLLCALSEIGGLDCTPPPAVFPKRHGIWELADGESEHDRLTRLDKCGKPVIGVLLHFHYVGQEDTQHVRALCEAVRQNGGEPLPVYTNMMPETGFGGLSETIDTYFIEGGNARIDVLIVTTGHSLTALSSPGTGAARVDQSVFAKLGVPVFQAMTTVFSYDEWKSSLTGLDSMLLCSNVYQPEFDGQIITVTFSCSEPVKTPDGVRRMNIPIPGRAEKIAKMATGYARLRRTPMPQRRVAVILHNMPPRADMIGCAFGLDTPESVFNMVEALKREGLKLDFEFSDGQEIIQRITRGLTNDARFLSPAEMFNRCERTVSAKRYKTWFAGLPESVRVKLTLDWGEAPGEFMTVNGEILVPGIHNGNLFIGLQPPRAYEEKAEELYHSTDLVCPHQYIAFYRYLREVFDAHVIVHVGTHGTLEWLPGKEIGLSEACYPEVALGEIPHVYPYIIDVPGEGAQAKRRSDAVIIDHLIPSMTDSGLYGELTAIDDSIAQYDNAKLNDPGKLSGIAAQIWEQAKTLNLTVDLGLDEPDFHGDIDGGIERIHQWLGEIKMTKVKNGLHIFGRPPVGERYADMLRLLVNIRNGDIPSLREGLADALGYDDDRLVDIGRDLFSVFAQAGYAQDAVDPVIEGLGASGDKRKLRGCLMFVADKLTEKLNATTDEITNFIRAVSGEFVPQGPSGAPSRGNAHILPTGRNFYMIDPGAVPTRAAWATGKKLADQLLKKHKDEQGSLPESIAIVVYSGETIKTTGDDIAEIMYLYGVCPVWLGNTDRVIGIEVIPFEELGRPRIDVTLRITGLFRDTFPNLIERIEDAVNLVATLDESYEVNFIKKHLDEDIKNFINDGMNREQAFEMASLRVFGCPPGTYGAGVDIMVNSKKWETSDDLGRAYINWSAHAYGRNIHGKKLTGIFERRMSSVDVTVKNISSFESDMLDDDDYYNYHGGLISAVKSQSGKTPVSYSTNAGDPEKVQTRTIHEDTSRIMRARIANPKWVKGLKEHGYRGAQELSLMVDIVFGWDATSGVIDNWMYDTIAEKFLLNDEIRKWIEEVNPWALHAMSERLLEASRRGMWDASDEILNELKNIFLSADGELEGL